LISSILSVSVSSGTAPTVLKISLPLLNIKVVGIAAMPNFAAVSGLSSTFIFTTFSFSAYFCAMDSVV